MSKGCFRVAYRESYVFEDGKKKFRSGDNLHDEHVPKSLIVYVRKYDNARDHELHYECMLGKTRVGSYWHEFSSAMQDVYACACKCPDWHDCACAKALFPLYELVVKNQHIPMFHVGSDIVTVPETVVYLMHPCEREHMERYLAGTDDPMYDFVHELRYGANALGGREKLEAKEDLFSGGAKRPRPLDK